MWRPARASRGTSGSPSSWGYGYGEPASRIASTPASRSTAASARASSSAPIGAPPGAMPMWQCASTSPGSTKPPSATVWAPGTGEQVTRSPTSHRSRTSSSGRTTPRTCSVMSQKLPARAAAAGIRLGSTLAVGQRLAGLREVLPGLAGGRFLERAGDDRLDPGITGAGVVGPVRVGLVSSDRHLLGGRDKRGAVGVARAGLAGDRSADDVGDLTGRGVPAAFAQPTGVADRAARGVERGAGDVLAARAGTVRLAGVQHLAGRVADLLDRGRRAVHAVVGEGGVRPGQIDRRGRRHAEGERAPGVRVGRLPAVAVGSELDAHLLCHLHHVLRADLFFERDEVGVDRGTEAGPHVERALLALDGVLRAPGVAAGAVAAVAGADPVDLGVVGVVGVDLMAERYALLQRGDHGE